MSSASSGPGLGDTFVVVSADSQSPQPFEGPIEPGAAVGVNFGVWVARGTIVEDRGEIGVGGRKLVRVKVPISGTDEFQEFEVPAEELVALPAVPETA
jgi:hypothetical protein